MSSEESRLDLELFINRGLVEGWQWWPLKQHKHLSKRIRGRCVGSSSLVQLLSCVQERSAMSRLRAQGNVRRLGKVAAGNPEQGPDLLTFFSTKGDCRV